MGRLPRWSPDGRQIAFVRQLTEHAGRVYLTSPLGGAERKLSDFEVHFDRILAFGHLSWTPDGQHILAARPSQQEAGQSTGIYLIPIDGGEPRALTTTRAPASDRDPAIAPDGRRLAYLSCENCCWGSCDVKAVELNERLAAREAPRRLTSLQYQMEGLTWTADGQALVFGAFVAGFYNLWRVGLDGRSPPERIELAGFNARKPSVAANRLVFGRWNDSERISRLTISRTPAPVGVSAAYHRWPALSPDGRHVAFCSRQSGRGLEVWLADADGSNARPLAPGCFSAWRRDGQMLAVVREQHVWTVDVQGGNLRRVTAGDPIERRTPSWSADGRWIYFAKVGRVGGPVGTNIWRIPAGGGPEQQVTRNGGARGFETPDGTALVYQAEANRSGLPILMVPLTGGPSQQLIACAYGFTVDARGMYYYPCRPSGAPVPLAADRSLDVRFIDPASGRDRLIATVPDIEYADVFWGPRVSPDGRTIVYTQLVSRGDDLMLIDNFR